MAKLNEQEFKKSLSAGSFSRVYLIYGEEKYLVRYYTQKLCEKVAGKTPSDFDFIKMPENAAVSDIIGACEQFPLTADYKCVVVTDYRVEELPESELNLLLESCQDISPSAVLIFTMPTLQPDAKKGGEKKGGKLKKLAGAVEKYGTLLELEKRGDIALEKQLVSWAEKAECELSRLNASKIIGMCGTELTTLENEIEKLCAYADKGEITEEMIRKQVPKKTEARIFDLSDCIAANDYNGAYKHLYALFEQNEKAEVILSTLSGVFIDMYRAKVAAESGKSISELASDFKYGRREFLLKKASSRASRYSTEVLRKILNAILETDVQLKSKPSEKQTVLETLLAKLLILSGNAG